MAAIGIIGTGTWGTAIAVLLNNSGHDVTLCSASGRDVEELKRTRCQKNLPGVTLDSGIKVTDSLKAACGEKDLLVLALPSVYIRQTAERIAPFVRYGQVIVSAAKGIEEESLLTMTGVIAQELPNAEVCALSGPSHAEEVSRGLPTTCVVAAERKKTAEYVQSVFMSPVFRVYTSADLLGVEIGGGDCPGRRYGGRLKLRGQRKGSADYPRYRRDHPAGRKNGCKEGNGQRPFRYGRPDCHLCQHAQQKPPGRHSHRTGKDHEGGYDRGPHGGGRRLCGESRTEACPEVPVRDAHCGTGEPDSL